MQYIHQKQNTMEGWVKVFASDDLMQAKFAEDVLKQEGIASHIVNKPDSVLPMLGEATLYVQEAFAEEATTILRDSGMLAG
jgi:Putative prokaryotic signal transducing protein